jgi:hypothetical protein
MRQSLDESRAPPPFALDCRSQSPRQTPSQWEIVPLVEALNGVAIETFVTDLHPGAQRTGGWQSLDGELDRLRCGRKASIAQPLPRPARLLSHEQLGGYAVVECHALAVGRHVNIPTCSLGWWLRQARLPAFSAGPVCAAREWATNDIGYKSRLRSLSLTTRSCGSSKLLMRY